MIWIYLDKVSEKLVGWWINGEMWCPTSLQMRQLGLVCCGLSWFMIVSTGETKHASTFCSISWEHHMCDYWWGAMLVCYSSIPILVGCSDFYLFRHNYLRKWGRFSRCAAWGVVSLFNTLIVTLCLVLYLFNKSHEFHNTSLLHRRVVDTHRVLEQLVAFNPWWPVILRPSNHQPINV